MDLTPAQLDILRARFPGIGVPTLVRNAALLLSRPQLRTLPPALAPTPQPTPDRASALSKPAKATKPRSGRVPRTRNGGTITEAAFWGMLRSGLRRTFRFWRPSVAALKAARIPCRGPRGQRWAYLCADCHRTFLRRQVQIDHVTPAGALTSYEHIGEFVRRLTPESPDAFAVRCIQCHRVKTNRERAS